MKLSKITTLITHLITTLVFVFTVLNIHAQSKVIDKVVAIVGGNEILYSDIENQYMQYLMQGYTGKSEGVRCQIFEEVLFVKLLLNQAQLDSVDVSEEMVENEMDRRLQYFISQIGSQEKLEKYYNKSILEIKSDMRNTIHDQLMSETIKEKIIKDLSITPSEIRDYFNQLPKDSIPLIPSEYQYSEIVIVPKVQAEEREYSRQKMEKIRARLLKGENFESLARIYSEDPGSALKGGELGEFGRGMMFPEFEAAAFALQVGEISPIVETEAGFHVLQLINRKGDYINVRHILIMTKISPMSLNVTKLKMDSIYELIESGKLTFEQSALKFSDDDSKFSAGVAINGQSGNSVFSPEEIDKDLFFILDKMNVGQISKPNLYDKERNVKAYRIVKLDRRSKPHFATLETDYDKIQELALENKKTEAIGKWIIEKSKKTYILILDDELKQCKFTYNWE
jgi:peptidyl-prolyl cis-trans isomerase SurA